MLMDARKWMMPDDRMPCGRWDSRRLGRTYDILMKDKVYWCFRSFVTLTLLTGLLAIFGG